MAQSKSDVLQGTLDLMILKTLESMGSLHGYGIARRIEQVSSDTLSLNQGTIYPALLRLEQRRWIKSEWGDIRDQPARQVLLAHQDRSEAGRAGRRELGADGDDHGALSLPVKIGGDDGLAA